MAVSYFFAAMTSVSVLYVLPAILFYTGYTVYRGIREKNALKASVPFITIVASLIVFYLVVFGIVPYKKLRGSWRVVYVVMMVISAMITPDASPVTMLLLFAAMIVLYEGSLLIARIVLSRKIKRQAAEAAAEGEDE